MRVFKKSVKLDHVCYDIRGPVMDEANRMIEAGEEILRLNIGKRFFFRRRRLGVGGLFFIRDFCLSERHAVRPRVFHAFSLL